jgi:hypothetical protein
MRSRKAGAGGSPAGVRQARNGVAGGYGLDSARHHTRQRTVARAGRAGAGETFYTLQAGTFYTFRGVSSRMLVRGNVLHLHLICANNDDKHGGGAPVGA